MSAQRDKGRVGQRYVVVLKRVEIDEETYVLVSDVVIGAYRSKERAESRAATVRRLADTYEDEYGSLHVSVELLRKGSLSAQDALDYLYGSIS